MKAAAARYGPTGIGEGEEGYANRPRIGCGPLYAFRSSMTLSAAQ